jgi:hypothetical protein
MTPHIGEGGDKPEYKARQERVVLGDADARQVIDLLTTMDETEKAELWNILRGRALREIDDFTKTRILSNGQPVTDDAAGNRIGFETESYADILNFRGAVAINDRENGRQFDISLGAGADCMFDYLVSSCWATEIAAGRGVQGQSVTSLTGCTFTVYSTVQAAFTAYQAEAAGVDRTMFICRGVYQEAVTLTTGPTSSTLRVFGAGAGQWNNADGATEITPVTGTAFTAASNAKIEWSDISFIAGVSGFALSNSGASVSHKFNNCYFSGDITGGSVRDTYDHCIFNGSFNPTSTVTDTRFNNCYWKAAQTSSGSTAWGGVKFADCFFAAAVSISNTHVRGLAFVGCTFGIDGGAGITTPWITLSQTGQQNNIRIVGCHFTRYGAGSSTGMIRIAAAAASYGYGNVISGNTFDYQEFSYIVSADTDVEDWCITGNAFGKNPSAPIGYLEENTAFASVSGNFKNSVFGPNSPGTYIEYSITGSGNVFFPGSAATGPSTGGSAGTDEPYVVYAAAPALANARQYITAQAGAPGFLVRPEGALYWNTAANDLYVNADGAFDWRAPMKMRVYTSLGESPAGVVNSFP